MLSADMADKLVNYFGRQFALRDWDDCEYVLPHEVSLMRYSDDMLAYVDLRGVGRATNMGDGDSVSESNYRSLMRDYPNVFTPTSFHGSDNLGAFLVDLDDALAEILLTVSVFDEDDLSALENSEIMSSWDEWARSDMFGTVCERTQEDWQAIGNARVEELLWGLVHAAKEGRVPMIGYGSGEECVRHLGTEVAWDFDGMKAPLSAAIQCRAHKLRRRGVIA